MLTDSSMLLTCTACCCLGLPGCIFARCLEALGCRFLGILRCDLLMDEAVKSSSCLRYFSTSNARALRACCNGEQAAAESAHTLTSRLTMGFHNMESGCCSASSKELPSAAINFSDTAQQGLYKASMQ